MKQLDAARIFGVSRTSIWARVKKYGQSGETGLRSEKRGRKPAKALAATQAGSTRQSVIGENTDQLRLPGFLWTREMVALLVFRRFSVGLSRWTVGRRLKDWGLAVQKPAKRALEQNPAQVRHWLDVKHPATARQTSEQRAEIFWGGEMDLRSEHQSFVTWGERCNMLSALTNRSRLAFMVFPGRFAPSVFINFICVAHNDDRNG